MTEHEQDLHQVGMSITAAKQLIKKLDALRSLQKNPAFKTIVEDGYFTEEAVRLVMVKGDVEFQTPEKQASVLRDIDGISCFNEYLRNLMLLGRAAESGLAGYYEEQANLLVDEAE